ncbi:MAG: hypothetical protein RIR11_351 [Bacteroidota bacterium]
MRYFVFMGIVGFPNTYQQCEGQVIEPTGHQHFGAAKEIRNTLKRKNMPSAVMARAQINDGKISAGYQQNNC